MFDVQRLDNFEVSRKFLAEKGVATTHLMAKGISEH